MTERDLGGLRAYASEVTAQYDQLRRGMADFQQELRELKVTGRSQDGYVTATVGARGQLLSLELDPRIYRRQDSAALARTITETVQQAVAEAGEKVARIGERYAPGLDVTSILRGDVVKRFERFDFIETQIAGGGADG